MVSMKTEAVTRKWGNSIGITLPKEIVDSLDIKENVKINIELNVAEGKPTKDFFGCLKGSRVNAQKFKDERREEDVKREKLLLRQLRRN